LTSSCSSCSGATATITLRPWPSWLRSLGLPARLVTGYLAQPPDAQGRQIIYANQAHSWVEIYLGEYGWIAFEPTAAFEDGRAIDEGGSAPVAAWYLSAAAYSPARSPKAAVGHLAIPGTPGRVGFAALALPGAGSRPKRD
jgi:transglutaminase-like putative cysteine protease